MNRLTTASAVLSAVAVPLLGFTVSPSPALAAGSTASGTAFAKLHAVSASSPTDAWVVGFSQAVPGTSLGLTRHWNGSRWTTVDSVHPLVDSFVWDVADLSPTDAWAVGEALGGAMILPFVEHWDGSAWQEVSIDGIGVGKLTAVSATGPDDVWMVGTRNDDVFQYPRPLVAHWNGHRIRVMRGARLSHGPSVELTSVSAVAPDDVWAVGAHGRHGQTYRPLVEHFDGTSWTVVPGDAAQGTTADLGGVDGVASDDAWSVGWYLPTGQTTIAAYAQHWDGNTWTQVAAPAPGYASHLTSVKVLSADDVWAVGSWQKTIRLSTSQPLVEHWDGESWSVVTAPTGKRAGTFVESISMADSIHGFAVGETSSAALTRPYVIRWDGTAWSR